MIIKQDKITNKLEIKIPDFNYITIKLEYG